MSASLPASSNFVLNAYICRCVHFEPNFNPKQIYLFCTVVMHSSQEHYLSCNGYSLGGLTPQGPEWAVLFSQDSGCGLLKASYINWCLEVVPERFRINRTGTNFQPCVTQRLTLIQVLVDLCWKNKPLQTLNCFEKAKLVSCKQLLNVYLWDGFQ